MDKKWFNEIAVRHFIKGDTWKKLDFIYEGMLAHGIFHFFRKSCCFDSIKRVKNKGAIINNFLFNAGAY